jgi:capsular polysaccharide biosynthesis protein
MCTNHQLFCTRRGSSTCIKQRSLGLNNLNTAWCLQALDTLPLPPLRPCCLSMLPCACSIAEVRVFKKLSCWHVTNKANKLKKSTAKEMLQASMHSDYYQSSHHDAA